MTLIQPTRFINARRWNSTAAMKMAAVFVLAALAFHAQAGLEEGRVKAQVCFACHGANYSNARDSNRTLAAIASNKGGMGYLSSTIQAPQANDIAAYLSYGL